MANRPLLLGLLGYPVTHSLSPALFRYFSEQANRAIEYKLFSCYIKEDERERTLYASLQELFDTQHLDALNITAPYKFRVGRLCVSHPKHLLTQPTEAVNLVWQKNGCLFGTNTDFVGASYLVEFANLAAYQLPVLVIGAGGASAPVLNALYSLGVEIICCNRTNEKAQALAAKYTAQYIPYEKLPTIRRPIIVFSALPHNVFFPQIQTKIIRAAIDVSYADSPLRQIAEKNGIPYISGYPWLFAQAVENYRIISGDYKTFLPYYPMEALRAKYAL